VKAGLERIGLVHSPIHDPARERADHGVGQRLGIVPDTDLAACHALLDQLEKRRVEGESTLNAVTRGGHHLGDHLAIRIARLHQGRRDVVEQADQPGGDRLVLAVEYDVSEVEQALLRERASCRSEWRSG